MIELKVLAISPGVPLPICANPGQDLGYDLFSIDNKTLFTGVATKIRTGIAVELPGYGFLIRDRSSIATKGIIVSGGVVDAGYRGEIIVLMTLLGHGKYAIKAGDKIAQMIPVKADTGYPVALVSRLSSSARGADGFGSTGV